MSIRVDVHPAARTAALTLGGAFAVILLLSGVKWITRADSEPTPTAIQAPSAESTDVLPAPSGDLLIPVIDVSVADATMESNWSASLARLLKGQTEAPVEGGRVDVLTSDYAIEVDRLDKWHEGIGQAAHYGLLTKAVPTVALIVPSDSWPLSEKTRAKLMLIDETCAEQKVKLVLLRRASQ